MVDPVYGQTKRNERNVGDDRGWMFRSWGILWHQQSFLQTFVPRPLDIEDEDIWAEAAIIQQLNKEHCPVRYIRAIRWPTSALRMRNDTPNSKLHSEFLNLTLNSKTSLRILEPHSKFQNLTPNSKTSLQIKKKLTLNSKTSLQIQKSHSEFFNLNPNSKISLQIQKHHSEF